MPAPVEPTKAKGTFNLQSQCVRNSSTSTACCSCNALSNRCVKQGKACGRSEDLTQMSNVRAQQPIKLDDDAKPDKPRRAEQAWRSGAEISVFLTSVAWCCWALQTAKKQNEAIALLTLALFTLVLRIKWPLSAAWLESSRTCVDTGVIYGTVLVPLVLAPRLVVVAIGQGEGSHHMNTPSDLAAYEYNSLTFWCAVGCGYVNLASLALQGTGRIANWLALFGVGCFTAISWQLSHPTHIGRGPINAPWFYFLPTMTPHVLANLVLMYVLRDIMRDRLPRCFTLGECLFVVTGVSLCAVDFLVVSLFSFVQGTAVGGNSNSSSVLVPSVEQTIQAIIGTDMHNSIQESCTTFFGAYIENMSGVVEKLSDAVSFRDFSLPRGIFLDPGLANRSAVSVCVQAGFCGVLWSALALYPFFRKYARNENETIGVSPRRRISSVGSAGGCDGSIECNGTNKSNRIEQQEGEPREGGRGEEIEGRGSVVLMAANVKVFDWSSLSSSATFSFYATILTVFVVGISTWASFLIGSHPVLWVLFFTFTDIGHMGVVAFWLACLGIGLPLIHRAAHSSGMPLILVRKLYHVLALFMFAPALLFRRDFLSLGFAVAATAMLLAEFIRLARVPPFGIWLNGYMRQYTDSRDEGILILTHLYLLCGCAAPVWLGYESNSLAPFAGLLILGAGDAAGAIVGATWGRYRWVGGQKTIEGTVAAVVSTVAVVWCVSYSTRTTLVHDHQHAVKIFWATLLTCLIEAFTKQIDNLVLPTLYFALLQLAQL